MFIASRSAWCALGALCGAMGWAGEARAQTAGSRATAGAVSGLEMSIEGPASARRGERIQWQLAVHEVTGMSGLRIAPGARVRVFSSLARDRAVAEVTTDAFGRAQVGLEVPPDAPDSFLVMFEAISRGNVRRQFEVDVTVRAGHALQWVVDRADVRPGATVRGFGRLFATATGRALADTPVSVSLLSSDGVPVEARVVRTDARGGFFSEFALPPARPGRYALLAQARIEGRAVDVRRAVVAQRPSSPALIVRAAPVQSVVPPRGQVSIVVSVRAPDGRPVRDAIVRSPMMTRREGDSREPSVRTDARGVARFDFIAPEVGGFTTRDLSASVVASHLGFGEARADARVRVARPGLRGALSVEGGALTEGLSGRVFVRLVDAQGAPAGAGVRVTLRGPRMGRGAQAVTDADGVAALDVGLVPAPTRTPAPAPRAGDEEGEVAEAAGADDCGGATATAVELAFERGDARGNLNSCVSLEPDATLRVRLREGALAQAGQEVHGTLERLPGVARTPVHVTLLARMEGDGTRRAPVVGTVVPAGENSFTLRIPAGVTGLVLVRARPLVGPLAKPALGGSTALWSYVGQRAALSLSRASDRGVALDPGSVTGLGAMVSLVPTEQAGSLWQTLREADPWGGLRGLRVDPARAGETVLMGEVSSAVDRDASVQAVLRGGALVDLPAPSEPAAWGVLRDPFRTSTRFVEGRLALLFQRIEEYVAAHARERRADIALRVNGRWEFNLEIFDAIARAAQESGDNADTSGGARNLGGAMLRIDDLRRLDPAFTFDNVARRITRKRLFALLRGLRSYVRERNLDLRWSWRGDPSQWLRSVQRDGGLTIDDSEGDSRTLFELDMVDGWGNPIELRPAPGGRVRFSFLSPVPGYDLVSAGPDERFGTADDIVDPFARVLPAGGAYARAVDEDGLLARLRGVELGRSTIDRLSENYQVEPRDFDSGSDDASDSAPGAPSWNALPTQWTPDPQALAILRPASRVDAVFRGGVSLAGVTDVQLRVDDEPRAWTAVAFGFAADGTTVFASRPFLAGTPVLVSLPIVGDPDSAGASRVRVGEPLELLASVTNLEDADRRFSLRVVGEGGVRASAQDSLEVPSGQSAEIPLRIEATRAGPCSVRVEVCDASGAVLRAARVRLLADRGGLALRDDAMTVDRGGPVTLRIARDGDASGATARLVLSSPSGLADDPELGRVRRTDPALIAWAYTMAGRALPPSLATALLSAQSSDGTVRGDGEGSRYASALLSTAAALSVWSSAGEEDANVRRARARAAESGLGVGGAREDGDAGRLCAEAAAVASLATGASGSVEPDPADPVSGFIGRSRGSLGAALEAQAAQPTLLARAAAALLLLDPNDVRGRAMYDLARRATVADGARGALVGAGAGRARIEEVLAASAAMAVAAQLRGDLALAGRLGSSVASRGHLAMRAGGEVAFWLLADAAFGVFGADPVSIARVTVDGRGRTVAMTDGHAVMDMPSDAQTIVAQPVGSPDASLFARWERVYERPAVARADGPVSLDLRGDVGFAGERSAMELSITGTADASAVAVEVRLPAGATLEPTELARLATGAVTSARLLDGGLVRLVVRSINRGQTVRVPLAVRWDGRGDVTGFGAVAYAASRPTQMSVLPARVCAVRSRPAVSPQ
jgi:hypothetical protein